MPKLSKEDSRKNALQKREAIRDYIRWRIPSRCPALPTALPHPRPSSSSSTQLFSSPTSIHAETNATPS